MKTILSKRKINRIGVILVSVFTIMLICCAYSSPLFPYYTSGDSSIFMMFGRGITEGKIIYRDLFDHKGPILFFIQALGWKIGGRTGIWIIEVLLTCLSVYLILEIAKLLEANYFLPLTGTALVYFTYFGRGNTCENYCVPLVYLCVYLSLRYMKSGYIEHPKWSSFVYGVCFSIISLIKVNNATAFCGLALCIILRLVFHKRFINLLINILYGIAGIVIIALPVCIYFYVNGSLYDMIYCTFIHNFIYAAARQYLDGELTIIKLIVAYAPITFTVLVFIKKFCVRKGFFEGSFLFVSVLYFIELVYLYMSARYQEPALPLYTVAACCAFPEFDPTKHLKSLKDIAKDKLLVLFLSISLVYSVLSAYNTAAPFYRHYLTDACISRFQNVSEEISVIPEEERNSVIGFEIPVSWYIDSGITPCYKFYSMQHWFSLSGFNAYGDFIEYVRTEHPKWIITLKEEKDIELGKTLKNEYSLISSGTYDYYRYQSGPGDN